MASIRAIINLFKFLRGACLSQLNFILHCYNVYAPFTSIAMRDHETCFIRSYGEKCTICRLVKNCFYVVWIFRNSVPAKPWVYLTFLSIWGHSPENFMSHPFSSFLYLLTKVNWSCKKNKEKQRKRKKLKCWANLSWTSLNCVSYREINPIWPL